MSADDLADRLEEWATVLGAKRLHAQDLRAAAAELRHQAARIETLEALVRDGIDLDGPGRVGRNHPETSRAAAALPQFGKERWRILDALAGHPHGATGRTIAAELGLRSPNQTLTRLKELREAGLVEIVVGVNGLAVMSTDGAQTPAQVQRLTGRGQTYRLAVLDEQG